MASGLSHGFSRGLFDAKPPRNLNDVDLFPLSTKPTASLDGPTEMAFVLIRNRLAEFVISQNKEKTGFGRDVLTQRDETNMAFRADRYRGSHLQFEQDVRELERRYINPSAGGVHSAAVVLCFMIANKFLGAPYLGRRQSAGSTGSLGDQDDVSEAVVKVNEDRTDAYMQLAKHGFAWFARHTFRVEVFADLVGHLRQWPVGHLSDRGWVVVDKTYRWQPELFDMERYVIQAHFTLEAFEAREQALARYGCAAETPWFITRLRKAFSTH
ncbi:transcriptional regulatory [Fusarium albosuccineum]|uniref:Transcriptional regulatory n=1 Tax=Fusarium albosuccineum TaxID=1237068 RepID=A0A8H4P1T9_9HYPO|nr:transcriptional regulatory [Fusarium albosuccineum]